MSSSGDSFINLVVGVVIGAGLIRNAIKKHKRVRQIQDTPRSKLSSAPQGYVEVQGFAWPKGNLAQTVEGHEAVYYCFSLERQETRGSGKNKKRVWVSIFTTGHFEPFFLVDPTGLVEIIPIKAEIEMSGSKIRMWKALNEKEKEHVMDLTKDHVVPGFPPSKSFMRIFADPLRIVESHIAVGSPLFASGDFRTRQVQNEKASDVGLTAFCNRVFDLSSRSFKNVKGHLDKNNDGKVSETEAREGYVQAAQFCRKKALVEAQVETELEVFGSMQVSENHSLFLADAHEDAVVTKLKRWILPSMVGGAAIMAGCLVLMLQMAIGKNKIEQMMATTTTIVPKEATLQVVSQRQPAESVPAKPEIKVLTNVAELHTQCLRDQVGVACTELIDNKVAYGLDANYLKFYSDMACKLGKQEHCASP